MSRKLTESLENPIDNIIYILVEFVAPYFHKFGITPNGITTMSVICGFSSAYFIYTHYFLLAAVLCSAAYFFDCLDGYVARTYNMVTKFGDYYDHVTDVLKYIAYLIALIIVNSKLFLYFVPIIIYFIFLTFLHMFYQESVYGKSDDSPCLGLLNVLFKRADKPKTELKYTRYFGVGTKQALIVLIILVYANFYRNAD